MSTFSHIKADLLAGHIPTYLSLLVGMTVSVGGLYIFNWLNAEKPNQVLLDGTTWHSFPLAEKIIISHNTALYRFSLPSPTAILGLPIGQHIQIQATIGEKVITRSYTPTSGDDDRGHFDIVVKTYEKGNISRYLQGLKIGDKVKVKGPKGNFIYTPTLAPHLSMIAGGTGITPMLQIITAALKNESDDTTMTLLYANVNENDILLRESLDAQVAASKGRLQVHHVLNNPPAQWDGATGFISKDLIEEKLGKALEHENSKMLLCGPPPMLTAMKVHLTDLGYPAARLLSKLDDKVFVF
ncbi:NADH-cytochrome b5 reductase 1 [Mrakia frigida]|uniref:cytochrome b5 reductase family protein n=1 Tax=Mrakia frigida TaxID=29902 RepID=UPI003FCBEF18